jgi:hypothetical protein
VPAEFLVEYQALVDNEVQEAAKLHKSFSANRGGGKAFFSGIDTWEVISVIRRLCEVKYEDVFLIPEDQQPIYKAEPEPRVKTEIIHELAGGKEARHVIEFPRSLHFTSRNDLGTAVLDDLAPVKRNGNEMKVRIAIYNDLLASFKIDVRLAENIDLFFFGNNSTTEAQIRALKQKHYTLDSRLAQISDYLLVDGRAMMKEFNEIYSWYSPWSEQVENRAKAKAFYLQQFVNKDPKKPSMFSGNEYKDWYKIWLGNYYQGIVELDKAQARVALFEMPDDLKSAYLRYRTWFSNWHINERLCDLSGLAERVAKLTKEPWLGETDHFFLTSDATFCRSLEAVNSAPYYSYYLSKRL